MSLRTIAVRGLQFGKGFCKGRIEEEKCKIAHEPKSARFKISKFMPLLCEPRGCEFKTQAVDFQ